MSDRQQLLNSYNANRGIYQAQMAKLKVYQKLLKSAYSANMAANDCLPATANHTTPITVTRRKTPRL